MVARLQYLRFCLFEMYVNVVFVIRCLHLSGRAEIGVCVRVFDR